MIDTDLVNSKTQVYWTFCIQTDKRPTYKGLAEILGVSESTICNVVHVFFNGHPYTDKPHVMRCIDNSNFETIKQIFE